MAHLVTKTNIHHYEKQMDQMFRLRHQVFVDEMGWDLPMARAGREVDQYDTEDTVYILSLNQNLDVVGSMRLLPTTADHLMSDLFSNLLDIEEPVGPTIWESSRTCVTLDIGQRGKINLVLSDVFIGMTEAAMLLGIEKVSFVANMQIYPSILQGGWSVHPLGLPKRDKFGEELVAAYVSINQAALHNVRQNRGILYPTLNYTNPHLQEVA
ncbi:acyl-homoserine-lactone synthase [Paremcibacter congregatus]|uniref:acyl-homoserine-lactone synthase n=1 Tax=Paremcibacter congregatus TaxID=2043170 RepID=UPI003A912B3E